MCFTSVIGLSELFVVSGLLVILVGGTTTVPRQSRFTISVASLILFFFYSWFVWSTKNLFNLVVFGQFLIGGIGLFSLIISHSAYRRYGERFPKELFILMGMVILGQLFLVGSEDLLVFYLSMELSSLCLYALAAVQRQSIFSTEAGLKYFILGAFSSTFLLLGVVLLYRVGGSIQFGDIFFLLDTFMCCKDKDSNFEVIRSEFVVGVLLLFVGLLFKLGSVPFHFWVPDVYEGTTLFNVAFFSISTKLGVVVVFIRFLEEIFSPVSFIFSNLLCICGVLSIFIGTVGALYQVRLKRLLAYSGMVHIGFLLLALSVGGSFGVVLTISYISLYLLLNCNLFSLLMGTVFNRNEFFERQFRTVNDFSLSLQVDPVGGVGLFSNLFSSAGVPPLMGFFGKVVVLFSLVVAKFYWSATIVVLLSVVSTIYYIRFIRVMFFEQVGWSQFLPISWVGSWFALVTSWVNFFGGMFFLLFCVLKKVDMSGRSGKGFRCVIFYLDRGRPIGYCCTCVKWSKDRIEFVRKRDKTRLIFKVKSPNLIGFFALEKKSAEMAERFKAL